MHTQKIYKHVWMHVSMYITLDKFHVFPGTYINKEERLYLLGFVQII